ncbi:uncharacterized protein AFUA_2G12040 [Aspergillus fumigatus Af293]|uniref:Uncharacterized protein n=1 Tax=Aspergillus fumigatus (strain ATCC MYA-4609 / CBS 101355 / FGSC A1100 / Af293) TaxID=330879 RepID=Q4X0W7_ASPFU|nr:hypothetical protein AFUA_2G12040 [Aspergillus fumigatus Af293]EAL93498.1 hypothetical protein AFUA_2G12040 [Aspergillus fumigatus Af293]
MKMAGDKTVEVTPSPRIGIEDSLECLPSIMDASITHGELTQELCLILYLTYSTGGGSLYCLTLTSVAPFPNIASIGGATTQIFCQGLAAPCAEVALGGALTILKWRGCTCNDDNNQRAPRPHKGRARAWILKDKRKGHKMPINN